MKIKSINSVFLIKDAQHAKHAKVMLFNDTKVSFSNSGIKDLIL